MLNKFFKGVVGVEGMVVFTDVTREDIARLLKKGYEMDTMKSSYEQFRLSHNGVKLILYNTGKLLLQGLEEDVEHEADVLGDLGVGTRSSSRHIEKEPVREVGVIVGSDESLKGDTFGGIVVAGARANDILRVELQKLGVDDSKKMSDTRVMMLAKHVAKIVPHFVIKLSAKEYNEFEGNVTELLDQLHKRVGEELDAAVHVVDMYPGCSVGTVRETKAESKYIEVAAASILARAAGLEQFEKMSEELGWRVPKGSTHVAGALERLQKEDRNFGDFVKLNFKNVREFL